MSEPLNSDHLWVAIDKIIEAYGGNARVCRKSDISLTTLAKTRRSKAWPSMKTIAKIINAHDMSLKDFVRLIE